MVDLWSENGQEDRARVLNHNHTPREKIQNDRKRQGHHDQRPELVISSLLLSTEPIMISLSRVLAQLLIRLLRLTIWLPTAV
jgi:hypothetical protein